MVTDNLNKRLMETEALKHALREGNTDIRWKETGEAIMSGYHIDDLSVVYWEIKKVLGDRITMAHSDVSEEDIKT